MDARDVLITPTTGTAAPTADAAVSPELGGGSSIVRGLVTYTDGRGAFHLAIGDRVVTGSGAAELVPGMLVEARVGQGGLASLFRIVASVVRADELRIALATASSAATTRVTTVPGGESALGELADALRQPHVPSPPLLAASLAAFVRQLLRTPDSTTHGADPSPTVASQGQGSTLGSRAAADLQAEGQRVVSQLLAEGRAEFVIPVDLPGRGWVRLRIGRRPKRSDSSKPKLPASISVLVEVPEMGAALIEATLSYGGIAAAITTGHESVAQALNERKWELATSFNSCGLRLDAIRIEADAARVAREWAAWPVPTLEGGSLIDTRA